MSTNPNTVKSQDDLPTTNDGKRSSDVLLEALSKLEKQRRVNQIKDEIIAILGVTIGLLLSDYIIGFLKGLLR